MALPDKIPAKFSPEGFDASPYILSIVVSEWYKEINQLMLDGCIKTLERQGVKKENMQVVWVPGAFEIPLTAQWMVEGYASHAVICLGCVIKGETPHHEYINRAVSQGLMNLSLQHDLPFIYGVLTTDNLEQAKERANGKYGNKGIEAAHAALRMIYLFEKRIKPY